MEVLTKLPVTLEERLEWGEELRIPATYDEFLDLLEECEYLIEYDDGEIISFMGYGTKVHESIAARILRLIGNLLDEELFEVYGSTLPLRLPEMEPETHYNAEVVVVKGEHEEVTLRGSMKATVNPILVAEVLSPSTRKFDLDTKLRRYRNCPSLQQILYVEQFEMRVTSYTRHKDWNEWLLREYTLPEDKIPILGEGHLSLKGIYKKANLRA